MTRAIIKKKNFETNDVVSPKGTHDGISPKGTNDIISSILKATQKKQHDIILIESNDVISSTMEAHILAKPPTHFAKAGELINKLDPSPSSSL